MEETTDESFVEDAADIDARRMAMKAAEGLLRFFFGGGEGGGVHFGK